MRSFMLKSIKTKFYRVGRIVLGIILTYIIGSVFLFSFFKVNSMSMYPTLEPGDSIYIDKGIYKIKGLSQQKGKTRMYTVYK